MGCHMVMEISILKDIHWKGSYLVHKQEVRYVFLLVDQMGRLILL